ncbi:unnamed protein product, partial [Iphiclides podalirius]
MAVGDNATSDESKVNSEDTATENVETAVDTSLKLPAAPTIEEKEEAPLPKEDAEREKFGEMEEKEDCIKSEETEDVTNKAAEGKSDEETRGSKRRASFAFSDAGEEFKGFDLMKHEDLCGDYNRVLERLEAEVQSAIKDLKPIRSLKVSIAARASKRPRQDTDGSRPSSALSSRSDGEWTEAGGSSGSGGSAGVRGRRSTTEMSSPLLRVPLERGWRRELVYRAALDAHSRRNADIYYYSPNGKKLRSTREVAEHLAGTGLTLENFSFFKEPLGVDDPEKEIIRDAKFMRRVESPVPAPPPTTEGKRTPKPKAPKGASPEPATPKSPPAKLKVKSMGSRLSNNGTPPVASVPKQPRRLQPAAASAPASATTATAPASVDNNNTAAWKKPRAAGASQPLPLPHPLPPAQPPPPAQTLPPPPPTQPPPLQSRPLQPRAEPETKPSPRQVVQPCSMSCGRGAVPSLACAACLCLYHPACAGLPHHHHQHQPQNFLCKNCKKSTSPPLEPPPLTHKSGATASAVSGVGAGSGAGTRRTPAPIPSPVPVPAKVRPDKRVLLRMKVAGGGADGSRVWAVAAPTAGSGAGSGTPPPGVRPTLPQSLAVLNGRRFIVVPRSLVHSDHH